MGSGTVSHVASHLTTHVIGAIHLVPYFMWAFYKKKKKKINKKKKNKKQ